MGMSQKIQIPMARIIQWPPCDDNDKHKDKNRTILHTVHNFTQSVYILQMNKTIKDGAITPWKDLKRFEKRRRKEQRNN